MSQSIRKLAAAVREFSNRPIDEEIDSDRLSDVIWELEGELEALDDPPEERRRLRAEAQAAALEAVARIRQNALRNPTG